MNTKTVNMVAFVLVVVGAINWGLVGLMNLNIVSSILGTTGLEKLVYILVGAAGVYLLATQSSKK